MKDFKKGDNTRRNKEPQETKTISELTYFEKFQDVTISIIMVIIVIVVGLQVCFRYILNLPLAWTEEIARYIFVWLTYFGAVIALNYGILISVDLLTKKFSPRMQYILALLRGIIVAVFLLVVTVYSVSLLTIVFPTKSPATQISMFYPYLAVPFGTFLMLFYVIRNIIITIRELNSFSQTLTIPPDHRRKEKEDILS